MLACLPSTAAASSLRAHRASAATAGSARTAAARADETYLALQRRFGRADGTYADATARYAHAWALSQALAASLEVGSLSGSVEAATARADARQTVRLLDRYRSGGGYSPKAQPPLDDGGPRYYDDNEWIGLDLLAAYRRLGGRPLLTAAENVFAFVVTGWDRDGSERCPGGIRWTEASTIHDRNTVSTANGALLAARLYEDTHARRYLTWAKRLYGWVARCLAAPDGLYYDHIDASGRIVTQEWAYNQGAMIAAGVVLAAATGDGRYLDAAEACAHAALAHYRRTYFARQPSVLVAIFFRDLRVLDTVRPDPAYAAALAQYVATHVHPRADGRFGTTLLDQAAAVQLYALAAKAG